MLFWYYNATKHIDLEITVHSSKAHYATADLDEGPIIEQVCAKR